MEVQLPDQASKSADAFVLDRVERDVASLLLNTQNALAIDELAKALAHLRHARRAIPRYQTNFQEGIR